MGEGKGGVCLGLCTSACSIQDRSSCTHGILFYFHFIFSTFTHSHTHTKPLISDTCLNLQLKSVQTTKHKYYICLRNTWTTGLICLMGSLCPHLIVFVYSLFVLCLAGCVEHPEPWFVLRSAITGHCVS